MPGKKLQGPGVYKLLETIVFGEGDEANVVGTISFGAVKPHFDSKSTRSLLPP